MQSEWQRSGAGGLPNYNQPVKFRDLFNLSRDTEVTELYSSLERVFNRINSFDFDYEKDEEEARRTFCSVENL